MAPLLVVGAGSALAYIMLALTINGQPPYRPFPGWVAVLQPFSQPRGDDVQLQVHSITLASDNGAPLYASRHPFMAYEVGVCGPHPYRGDLLIGGAARVTRPYFRVEPEQGLYRHSDVPELFGPYYPPSSFHRQRHLFIRGIATNLGGHPPAVPLLIGDAGPVQVVAFTISEPRPCPANLSSDFPPGPRVTVAGFVSAPVEQSWTAPFGWWHGPNISAAWPLAGTLCSVGRFQSIGGCPVPGLRYSYEGTGLTGRWQQPTPEYIEVSPHDVPNSASYGIPFTWSVDVAQPAVAPIQPTIIPTNPVSSDAGPLTWLSTSPIDPIARLTDTGSLATLQDWLIVAAVGMGIIGSMLASLAFEMLGPRHRVAAAHAEDRSPGSPTANPAQSRAGDAAGSRRSRHLTLAITAAVMIGLVRHWQARHRAPGRSTRPARRA